MSCTGALPGWPLRMLSIGFVAVACIVLAGCTDSGKGATGEPEFRVDGMLDFVRPDGSVALRIAVEIADTPAAQAVGMMGRRSIPRRAGMLFAGSDERQQRFWMKNTPLPLDIIFVRRDSTISNIVKRTRPFTEDYIESQGHAQHVLEVRAGFTDRMRIDESMRIAWRRVSTD